MPAARPWPPSRHARSGVMGTPDGQTVASRDRRCSNHAAADESHRRPSTLASTTSNSDCTRTIARSSGKVWKAWTASPRRRGSKWRRVIGAGDRRSAGRKRWNRSPREASSVNSSRQMREHLGVEPLGLEAGLILDPAVGREAGRSLATHRGAEQDARPRAAGIRPGAGPRRPGRRRWPRRSRGRPRRSARRPPSRSG